MLAYILNKHGQPLMPCRPGKARRLLRDKKAKVVSRLPFVIRLLHGSSGYIQVTELKQDSGSKTAGVAAVRSDGKVLYASEVSMRNDIPDKMEVRASYRRTRRGRNTRYRPARFDNRRRPEGWLTPTMRSKVRAHFRELEYVKSILPIAQTRVETASFDTHKLTNPGVSGEDYQKGRQKDFYNVKAFVLSRDKYSCQKCEANKAGTKLHVHHVVFRSHGGTNSPDNLVTLCESCHAKIHAHKNAEKESLKLQSKKKINTTDATQASTIGAYLKKTLISFIEHFGYETKFNRDQLGLPKGHFVDAMCIGLEPGEVVEMPGFAYKKVCVARGDYQRTRGRRSEQVKPKGKTHGFSRFDKVLYDGKVCFVRARMSTGYAILMDIDGNKIEFKPMPKFSKMKKLASKSSVLCHYKTAMDFITNGGPNGKQKQAA
jgi:5-methylcytosine-specific restriction endonuclease McrA